MILRQYSRHWHNAKEVVRTVTLEEIEETV